MAHNTIEEILRKKQAAKAEAPSPPVEVPQQEDKFFSITVGGEGLAEHMLEIRTRNGVRTCFSYADLVWLFYDPETGITIAFGGYLVQITGRGLVPRLFEGLRQKRVAWIKEADTELQDHKDNDVYIADISVTPPNDFLEEEAEEASAE